MTEYGPALRSIGQALERLGAEDFDLEIDGEAFLVRCRLPRPKATAAAEPDQAAILRHIWGVLPGQSTLDLDMTLTARFKAADIDLLYTMSDVSRLDAEGKAKRSDSPTEPGAPSLSQFLRTVGAYVDEKPARLLYISRKDAALTIRYVSPSGERGEEVLSVVEQYDLWVRMNMKRANRNPS